MLNNVVYLILNELKISIKFNIIINGVIGEFYFIYYVIMCYSSLLEVVDFINTVPNYVLYQMSFLFLFTIFLFKKKTEMLLYLCQFLSTENSKYFAQIVDIYYIKVICGGVILFNFF